MASVNPLGRPPRYWPRGLHAVTGALIGANVLCFLLEFFSQQPLGRWLWFVAPGGWSQPWTLFTYVLHTPIPVMWLLLALYVLWWVGNDLERRWGTLELGLVVGSVALIGSLSYAVAGLLLGGVVKAGVDVVIESLLVSWCMVNPGGQVAFMMVLPIQARWIAYLTLALAYFGTGHPILGLFALPPLLFAWWYATRGRVFRNVRWPGAGRSAKYGDVLWEAPKPRASWTRTWNPIAWVQRRRRRREFERMMRASGLMDDRERGSTNRDKPTLH